MAYAALLLLLCVAVPGSAQFFVSRPGPTRQISTNTFLPSQFSAANTIMMARSRHRSPSPITVFQTVSVGFQGIIETAVLGSGTQTESIEYPVGTCTQGTYAGATSAAVPSAGILISDKYVVSIPANTDYYRRVFYTNASGIPTTDHQDSTHGERLHFGNSGIADQTVSCDAITNTASTAEYYPAAIIGPSNRPAICIEGDSRGSGTNDTYDSTGFIGSVARSVGPVYPYLNMSVSSKTAGNVNTAHTGQLALSAYCTSMISELGGRDIFAGASAATTLARLQTFYTTFAALPIWQTTFEPFSTSTDNWTTVANQTATVGTQRISANGSIRAGTAQVQGFFDVANAVEFGAGSVLQQNGGFWCVSGNPGTVAQFCSLDGLHENQTGYLLVKNSGAIDSGVLQ